jgi:hypothetical protein
MNNLNSDNDKTLRLLNQDKKVSFGKAKNLNQEE